MARDASLAPSLDLSPRTAARVAGLGLLLMALFAAFANFYVLETLVVAQAEATVKNLTAATGLVRLGVVCFLVVALLDVVVAWGLYALLGPVSRSLSLLAAWFRIVYAAAFALSLNPLLTSVQLLSGADYLSALGPELLQAQVMLSLSAFESGWQLSLALFGCHLLVLGALVFKSCFLPRWLGFLLGVAGLGYLIDSFGTSLTPDYTVTLSAFTFVGEVLLLLWLLWRSVKGFAPRPAAQLQKAK